MTAHDTGDGPRRNVEEGVAIVGRDEWLLDEAIMETFPASDPAAPYQHAIDEQAGKPVAATQGEGQARDR